MNGTVRMYFLAFMHRCLRVDEIARLIAHELVAAGGQATAVALACCSKGFEDLALDALWGTQSRLVPLLQTLPADVWSPERSDVSIVMMTSVLSLLSRLNGKSLGRPPTEQEWDRLWKYAQKMREVFLPDLPSQVLSLLQPRTLGNPLLPNLEVLRLWEVFDDSIPFIPLFLSTRTTTIHLGFFELDLHTTTAASIIATFPGLCPNLREIHLTGLPRHPIVTVAVSKLVLGTNKNTLQHFHADSPLTEEARKAIYNCPDLRTLQTVFNTPTASPTMTLPNLTYMYIEYYHGRDWLQGLRGASLGKLTSVTISSESDSIDDFLGAFKAVLLTTSIPATLTAFRFITRRSWRPIYHSLLPFTQLKNLAIGFSCDPGCSSTIDDDTVTDLARAMPALETLRLGNSPCGTPGGVTVRGLAAIAHYCRHLFSLIIHFQVASLDPQEVPVPASSKEFIPPREGCTLKYLGVGWIRVQEESTLMVALTLLNIFPHLEELDYLYQGWEKIADAIYNSKQLSRCSSKKCFFVVIWSMLMTNI